MSTLTASTPSGPVNITYLQTPFHVNIFTQFAGSMREEGFSEDWVIFYDSIVEERVKNGFPQAITHKVEGLTTSINMSFGEQLANAAVVRKSLKTYRRYIRSLDIEAVVTFSEKNLLMQLLLSLLPSRTQVWGLDEGIGSYVMSNEKDHIKKKIYPILNTLLLGFPYQFYRVLGSHPRIDKLVLRVPELRKHEVPKGASVLSFAEAGIQKNSIALNQDKIAASNRVLMLTSVRYELYTDLSHQEEREHFEAMVRVFLDKGYEVEVKPHPRESSVAKYNGFEGNPKVQILDESQTSESLHYDDYAYIMMQYSSAVIDIKQLGYPIDRILTLELKAELSSAGPLFRDCVCLEEISELENYVPSIQ